MFLLNKKILKFIFYYFILIIISCNKAANPDEDEDLKQIENTKNKKQFHNDTKSIKDYETKVSESTLDSINANINNYTVNNSIKNNESGSINEKNNDENIKIIQTKDEEKIVNQTKDDVFEEIKKIIANKNISLKELKSQLLNLYNQELNTISLPDKATTDKEKSELVQRAIRFRSLRLILKIVGIENQTNKTKLEKNAIEEIELIGLAGTGPKKSDQTEDQIKQNNIFLIKSDDDEAKSLEEKEKEWVENFLKVTDPLVKYAEIWESNDIMQKYLKLDKPPIISDDEYKRFSSDIFSKLDLKFNELEIGQKFENNDFYNIKIGDHNFIINKKELRNDKNILDISINSSDSFLFKFKIGNNEIYTKEKITKIISAIEKYNEIFFNQKQNIISKFRLEDQLCFILDKTENQLIEEDELFNRILNRYKLLQKLSIEEFEILKKNGIISSPKFFHLDIPEKRRIEKTFKCSYKNNKGNLIEKIYKEGDEISNKLSFYILETSLALFEELYLNEIKITINEINNKYSENDIKEKMIKNNKIILTKEFIDLLEKNLQNNNNKYYKAFIKAIPPQIILNETIMDGLNKSAPFTNNDEELTTSVSTFSEENKENELNPINDVDLNNQEIHLNTKGELRSFFNINYFTPEGIIKDLIKLKPIN